MKRTNITPMLLAVLTLTMQNITPLFKLADGTKAYPSSLSIGVDIYYLLSRRW